MISRRVNRLAAASMAVSDADLTVFERCSTGSRVWAYQAFASSHWKLAYKYPMDQTGYTGNSLQFALGSTSPNFVNPDPII